MAPVLQVARADMEDPAESALRDQLVRERQRRHASVVEPDEGLDALLRRLLRGVTHRPGIVERSGERLLARDVLARLERRDRHLGMQMVRGADVHEIDLGIRDQRLPVGGAGLPAPLLGETTRLGAVASAGRLHHDRPTQFEESRRTRPCVGVRAAHELRSDDADPQRPGVRGRALRDGLGLGRLARRGLAHGSDS